MQIGIKPANKSEASQLRALKRDINLFSAAPDGVKRRPALARIALYAATAALVAAACLLPYVRLGVLTERRGAALLEAGAYASEGFAEEEAALTAQLERLLEREAALRKWSGAMPRLGGVLAGVYDNRGGVAIQKVTLDGEILLIEGRASSGGEAASFAERLAGARLFGAVNIREIAENDGGGYVVVVAAGMKAEEGAQ